MSIDRTALLTWLHERSSARDPIIGAIYDGLKTRIERGDFDEREGK